MNIRLKSLEELDFQEPVPWYAHETFQGVDIEVEDSPIQKQKRFYWKLKNSIHNWICLKSRETYLSNRMKQKLEGNALNTVFIEFECANINDMNNKNLHFLLREKEEELDV